MAILGKISTWINGIGLSIAGGVILFGLNWIWGISKKQSEYHDLQMEQISSLKVDILAAFGGIQETEIRSVENAIRSRVNEEKLRFFKAILSIAIGQEFDIEKLRAAIEKIETSQGQGALQDEMQQPQETGDQLMQQPIQQAVPVEKYMEQQKTKYKR